ISRDDRGGSDAKGTLGVGVEGAIVDDVDGICITMVGLALKTSLIGDVTDGETSTREDVLIGVDDVRGGDEM
ncbi:hypothetical protein KI387_003470, partial [Taxus chinensis]